MKLPNGNNAIIDNAKLNDYCLSFAHPRGRHKARVFQSVLGITSDNSGRLKDALREAAASGEAIDGETDEYGQRFVIDFELRGPTGSGKVRSAWIILTGEDCPRLISCYVL